MSEWRYRRSFAVCSAAVFTASPSSVNAVDNASPSGVIVCCSETSAPSSAVRRPVSSPLHPPDVSSAFTNDDDGLVELRTYKLTTCPAALTPRSVLPHRSHPHPSSPCSGSTSRALASAAKSSASTVGSGVGPACHASPPKPSPA